MYSVSFEFFSSENFTAYFCFCFPSLKVTAKIGNGNCVYWLSFVVYSENTLWYRMYNFFCFWFFDFSSLFVFINFSRKNFLLIFFVYCFAGYLLLFLFKNAKNKTFYIEFINFIVLIITRIVNYREKRGRKKKKNNCFLLFILFHDILFFFPSFCSFVHLTLKGSTCRFCCVDLRGSVLCL